MSICASSTDVDPPHTKAGTPQRDPFQPGGFCSVSTAWSEDSVGLWHGWAAAPDEQPWKMA